MSEIMTTEHKEWETFCTILEGDQGCNFQKDTDGKITWNCKSGTDKTFAEKILKEHFPNVDIVKTLEYFEQHGGYCDCEILFNVAG